MLRKPIKIPKKIVNIHKDDKKDIIVCAYEDNTTENCELKKDLNNRYGLKYIEKVDSHGINRKYWIVEDEKYIEKKFASNDMDFSYHAFFVSADFSGNRFIDVYFNDTTFLKDVSFKRTEFFQKVDFSKTLFFGENDFRYTKFMSGADFTKAKFFGETSFYRAKFLGEVSFSQGGFYNFMDFKLVRFKYDAEFMDIFCEKNAEFDFDSAIFQDVFIMQLTYKIDRQVLKLNLYNISLDARNLNYNDILLESLHNDTSRITYSRLKDSALERHDSVAVLELHKKENEAHLKEVTKYLWRKLRMKKKNKKEKNMEGNSLGDFVILSFEWVVSYFGTVVWSGVLLWISVWLFMAFVIVLIGKGDATLVEVLNSTNEHNKDLFLNAFHPLSIMLSIDSLKEFSNWKLLVILNYIKTILLSLLAYEIIKSFRRFSRFM